jgi:hypothetical protein
MTRQDVWRLAWMFAALGITAALVAVALALMNHAASCGY